MEQVASCFARRETRQACRHMVNGLPGELGDHDCWTMAEAAGRDRPYRMQHLLSRARVDDQQVLVEAADWAAGHLSAGHDVSDVVLIVDETAGEESSDGCVGAACQYSGAVGGTALCQVTVALAYAALDGHVLIGRGLYLPEGWAADEERRERAGYVAGNGPFQERSQMVALAHAFLWDYAELVRRWATWAQQQDTSGPITAQDDNAFRRALRGGPVLPPGPDTRDPQGESE